MENQKYKVGDEVKIVKYGALIWENKNVKEPKSSLPLIYEDENIRWLDLCPEVVGQTGIVVKSTMTQKKPLYAIDGIEGKGAWYCEEQMEKI